MCLSILPAYTATSAATSTRSPIDVLDQDSRPLMWLPASLRRMHATSYLFSSIESRTHCNATSVSDAASASSRPPPDRSMTTPPPRRPAERSVSPQVAVDLPAVRQSPHVRPAHGVSDGCVQNVHRAGGHKERGLQCEEKLPHSATRSQCRRRRTRVQGPSTWRLGSPQPQTRARPSRHNCCHSIEQHYPWTITERWDRYLV